MRIMIFGACYEPDLGPSAPLYTMLCENLVRLGHQVTMIAPVPHYPSGTVSKEYRGKMKWLFKSTEKGVEVIRVWVPSLDRSKFPLRLIQFAFLQAGTALAGLGKKYDVVMASSSSLSAWLPWATMVVLPKKPALYSVADVYPGVGVTLGVFRSKAVVRLVTGMELFCLNNAEFVRILSDSFRPELHAMGVPEGKIELVYDWVDTDLIRPLPKDNAFAREHGLADQFVVLYAGNLGMSQGLETVLAAAERLADQRDVCFVFVGDGTNRQRLMEQAEQKQLQNVKFIPFQPRPRLPEVLASADISLISLQPGIGSHSIPSKTYSILASGRALLASIDAECEAVDLVGKAGAGVCIPPNDPEALAEAVMALKNDPERREKMGRDGRAWAEAHHSPLSAARKIEMLMQQVITSHGNKLPNQATPGTISG